MLTCRALVNRSRALVLIVGLVALGVLVAVLARRRPGAPATPGSAGPSASEDLSTYTGGEDRPFAPKCAPVCDLSTPEGRVRAYHEVTGKTVAQDHQCSLASRRYPKVVAFGSFDTVRDCKRLGVFFGCCFTGDPGAASHDALQMQEWATSDFKHRAEIVENWVALGFWGMREWKAVQEKQQTWEAKLMTQREIQPPQTLPYGNGGVKLRMWFVHESLTDATPDAQIAPHKFEYTRWEFLFADTGTFIGEKKIDMAVSPG